MKTHNLKTHVDPFCRVWSGAKTAELRKDDRDFKMGDTIVLREYKHRKQEYTGRWVRALITDIVWVGQWVDGVEGQWAMLSFNVLHRGHEKSTWSEAWLRGSWKMDNVTLEQL